MILLEIDEVSMSLHCCELILSASILCLGSETQFGWIEIQEIFHHSSAEMLGFGSEAH